MKNKLMSLKVDFAFKEIMNDEIVRNSFISAVLKIPMEDIKSTQILNTYLRKEHIEDKQGILDVRVTLNNMEIDIEIQVEPFKHWEDRTLFYTSKMYIESIEAGDSYNVLKKIVNISILDFNLLKEENFHNSFHIRNDESHTIYTDKMEWHTIELPKIPKNTNTINDLLELWASFIQNSENEEVVQVLAKKSEYIDTAYNVLQKISTDKEKRMEYDARQKAIYDQNTLKIQHKEEGGKEKALKLGLLIEQISEITELTIEEVEALKINN